MRAALPTDVVQAGSRGGVGRSGRCAGAEHPGADGAALRHTDGGHQQRGAASRLVDDALLCRQPVPKSRQVPGVRRARYDYMILYVG